MDRVSISDVFKRILYFVLRLLFVAVVTYLSIMLLNLTGVKQNASVMLDKKAASSYEGWKYLKPIVTGLPVYLQTTIRLYAASAFIFAGSIFTVILSLVSSLIMLSVFRREDTSFYIIRAFFSVILSAIFGIFTVVLYCKCGADLNLFELIVLLVSTTLGALLPSNVIVSLIQLIFIIFLCLFNFLFNREDEVNVYHFKK